MKAKLKEKTYRYECLVCGNLIYIQSKQKPDGYITCENCLNIIDQ